MHRESKTLYRKCVTFECSLNRAFAHYMNAMAQVDKVLELDAADKYGRSFFGHSRQFSENLAFGSHINTLGWLMQDVDLRHGISPLANQDLLLVTPTERG
jgi:hypothetical protein